MALLRHLVRVAFLATALVPTPAFAQAEVTGSSFYASISGLRVVPADLDVSTRFEGSSVSSDLEMDSDFGLLIAFGYGAEVGLRGELELGFRNTDFDKSAILSYRPDWQTTNLQTPVIGDVNTLSLMANGIYAFEAGRLRPYFGVGIGLARHDGTVDTKGSFLGAEFGRVSDDDVVLAYQGMAGVILPLSERTEVRLGYRYFASADAEFAIRDDDDDDEFDDDDDDDDFDNNIKASYGTHNFEVGILFRF